MKKIFFAGVIALGVLTACNKDGDVLTILSEYNYEKEQEGYHFGDIIDLPKEIKDVAQSIEINFGDKQVKDLKITEENYKLGDNSITFIITTKDGKTLTQEATINVFASHPEKELGYEVVHTYDHDKTNFVQGFQLEGNTIYESVGQYGSSKLMKYALGTVSPIVEVSQSQDVFSEGATIVGDEIYQLTWQNKKGFIYDKATLKQESEFVYPNAMLEGWGLTYDGTHLLASDGTKNIYFLDPKNPSHLVKYISVAGNQRTFDQINELEYHNGFIYANIWQSPTILKINPKTGEVVATIDLSKIAVQHTTNSDDILNGIAFKGENMLITGKNWNKIYEISIKE